MPTKLGSRTNGQARNSSDDPEEFRAPLGDHLDDLRDRIIRSVLLIGAGWIVGWFIQEPVYRFLNARVMLGIPKDIRFQEDFFSITEPFMFKMKFSFMIGLGLVIPIVIMQLWGFIAPGLKRSERKPVLMMTPISVLLFAGGCATCWWLLPSAFQWFGSYVGEFAGAGVIQPPGTLVFFVLKMLLAFGVGFQLPVVVFLLGKMGLVSVETLTHYWRQLVVGIFFLSAALTPSGDIFTMTMMAVPLCILFLASVVAVKLTVKKSSNSIDELNDLD